MSSQPAVPDPTEETRWIFGAEPIDVGAFTQGNPASRWALARYLVGRAIAQSLGRSLTVGAVLLFALTALTAWLGWTLLAVLLGLLGLGVLIMRLVMGAVLRRFSAARHYEPLERRLRALVRQTRRDVHLELRRAGLPSHTWTLPLIPLRLLRRHRRRETLSRLREFRVDAVVSPARVDELHLLVREAITR